MTDRPSTRTDRAANRHLDDETLSASLDRQLGAEERSAAAGHLAICAACRDRLERLSRAAEAVGRPVEPVAAATLQRQLERAIDSLPPQELADSGRHAHPRRIVVGWAASLLVLAGFGAALWHFEAGSSQSAARYRGARAMSPEHSSPEGGAVFRTSTPDLQLRLLEARHRGGCGAPSANAHNPSAAPTTLYDASASASALTSSAEPACSRVGSIILQIDDATGARVAGPPGARLDTLILSVPAASSRAARSLLIDFASRTVAVVVRGQVIGYLSSTQTSGPGVTIVRVPATIARAIATQLRAP